jgi:hypothetical protein
LVETGVILAGVPIVIAPLPTKGEKFIPLPALIVELPEYTTPVVPINKILSRLVWVVKLDKIIRGVVINVLATIFGEHTLLDPH